MKITTWIAAGILIGYGLGAALFALTGIDLLRILTFGNGYVYRALLSLAGVGAAWLLFWLIAFRPTGTLS